MYFKKLELIGFKSFLNKTTLNFEPGITAVVGPNGTGKSNLVDGVRWVLGEQSARSLRGSDMQDVIFSGTDSKEPLSMAEVSLTFDNKNKFFNIDQDEVSITRRIFRSGESEYLLNKSLVRLKDILDLLMGTGIGAESYSMVAQGNIDLVLSSKPEDRRLVFDEASGITKYKSQKKEAIRKLEETEANLLRVCDIIAEVKRQISSLERQANKARKYKEVFEELKSKEINFAVLQKETLLKHKEEIIKQLSELESEEIKFLEAIKEQESKISNRQSELKSLENNIMSIRNEILNLDNLIVRNKERIGFNQDRIEELKSNREYLEKQVVQVEGKLVTDEEKLNNIKNEYSSIKKDIEEKTGTLKDKQGQLDNLISSIKSSLANITQAKKEILELVTKIANTRNELADLTSKQQIYLARKRRLELEKAKVSEEKMAGEGNLKSIEQEIDSLNQGIQGLNLRSQNLKDQIDNEELSLNSINSDIERLERQQLTLESHREFIEKLKSKYDDIGERLNAVIYLDKLPHENVDGLVVKIKEHIALSDEDKAYFEPANFKMSGEAKPIDLETKNIIEKLANIQKELDYLRNNKVDKEKHILELNQLMQNLQGQLRNQDIALANKKTSLLAFSEQFNKIKEEEDLIIMELSDVEQELKNIEDKLNGIGDYQKGLETEHKKTEELIANEQNSITHNTESKEKVLVLITQIKTECDALSKRISLEAATVKILEDTYNRDKENLSNLKRQVKEGEDSEVALTSEINDSEDKIKETKGMVQRQKELLTEAEDKYSKISDGTSDIVAKIESDRNLLDKLKDTLYGLQMRDKEIEFKFQGIKDRILQGYKIDLDTVRDVQGIPDENQLSQEIHRLKDKLDSYGTVNLVAIEEYDELKKRYDFLIQQQTDLNSAKESLHEAILKINRTTKKMFVETFEKVRAEFRNYFRLLFNGGDAQVFLIDEQDPLESGIEIICRPPGKKLQNVLLLSGGEKSLSAIALIFAIFKVKPSPFCVLDEIDAALDEANVDRFGRILQEFVKISQFIVITHNKRTIANADVMYGITMEDSGVSKIVSVKFAQDKQQQQLEVVETI